MPKKKQQARKAGDRKRKYGNIQLTIAIAIATLAIALIIIYILVYSGGSGGPAWHLDDQGLLAFSARPAVAASSTPVAATQNWTLDKITYKSFGDNVYALLRIPANVSKPPVVIVLPGATVNKEADAGMAEALASWGYATLTLDERGNSGETPGPWANDLNSGYSTFASGGDPVQYEQVYDVLLGYDYIRSRPDLDTGNVAVLGESMGGRFAIVAAALEPGLKAAFAVSGGPYGIQGTDDTSKKFMKSIEPAGYLSKLSPRKLVMFHFIDDPIIPLSYGKQLYNAASQPKAWHEYDGTIHGVYDSAYAPDLHEELRSVFGR